MTVLPTSSREDATGRTTLSQCPFMLNLEGIMKKLIYSTFIGASLLIPVLASAVDGALGATSTGSFDITLNSIVPPASEIQISGLQDISFDNVAANETPSPVTLGTICVYLSTASTYAIEIDAQASVFPSSSGNLGTSVASGTHFRHYNYEYTDPVGLSVTSNQPTSGLVGSSNPVCSLGDMAQLTISPQAHAFASPNPWTGTFSITVTPE
jgi:hypothetical protein